MKKLTTPVLITLSSLAFLFPNTLVAQKGGVTLPNPAATHVLFSGAASQPLKDSVSDLARRQSSFTMFDVPGSVSTYPVAINFLNVITGSYRDASYLSHGFVRGPGGTISVFDVPGAAGTFPVAMNEIGVITGSYTRSNPLTKALDTFGFVLNLNRVISTFDIPETYPSAINLEGTVTGTVFNYSDGLYHGFVRTPDGQFTTFDPPGSLSVEFLAPEGTRPNGINLEGEVIGEYQSGYSTHGFLRAGDGTISTFDPPDVLSSQMFTTPTSINLEGVITGNYYSYGLDKSRGFVRYPNGTFETFDACGGSNCVATVPVAINALGVVAGRYIDSSLTSHGFWRTPDGQAGTFDAPGSGTGFDASVDQAHGTLVTGINLEGVITGASVDNTNAAHGFLYRTR